MADFVELYHQYCVRYDGTTVYTTLVYAHKYFTHHHGTNLMGLSDAVVFYNYYRSKGLSAPVDLTIIEFVVVLPMIGFIWMLHNRRNQCLDWLSEVKCGMLYLIRSFSVADLEDDHDHEGQDDQHGDTRAVLLGSMSRACMRITLGMHNYFLPSRFYSTRYPYLGYKSAMVRYFLGTNDGFRPFAVHKWTVLCSIK